MYKGSRDSMLGIVVPQNCCDLMIDKTGMQWVEVFVPPRRVVDMHKPWASIVVPPNQVCFIDDTYNEVFVNAYALLQCYYKDFQPDGSRYIVGSESDTSELILARFLQYEYCKHHFVPAGMNFDLGQIEQHYQNTGLKMIEYIKRWCM